MSNTAAEVVNTSALTRLSSSELTDFLTVCLAAPMDGYPGTAECLWGLPVLIEGMPGMAKTARIKQMAKMLNARLSVFFAAPHPPESFAGALIPDGAGGAVNVVALSELRSIISSGTGILFFDELNGAVPATQGAIQSLIHERITGGCEIPGSIRIIAAQNPEDIATGGNRLAPAVANRFVHISDPGPSVEEWGTWLMGGGATSLPYTLDDLEKRVVEGWPDHYPSTQGLFRGYMQDSGGANLHKLPAMEDPNSCKAWPSHRTWDYAVRAWCTQKIIGVNDSVASALIEACVGVGAAQSFLTYATSTKLPTPVEVLNGKWKIDPSRLDIVLAAYSSATAYVCQRPEKDDRIKYAPQLWEAFGRLIAADMADIVVQPAEQILAAGLGRNSGNTDIIKAATPVLVQLTHSGLLRLTEEKVK